MRRISQRWSSASRSAIKVQIESLEQRMLLSTTVTPALNNPIVPISPLPTGTEPLQGIVGTPLSLDPQMFDAAYEFNSIFFVPTSNPGEVVVGNGGGFPGATPTSPETDIQTIAIVDPYGSPTIANDLQIFDEHWGISNDDAAGNFCLTVQALASTVNTMIGSAADQAEWAQETTLDVEWAHAVAPGAHILLVEAPSASLLDLMDADVYAAAQPGVVAVSMSWGVNVTTIEAGAAGVTTEPYLYDGFMVTPNNHLDSDGIPGDVAFFAASGDALNGAPTAQLNYPAASENVISVGGQTIVVDINGNLETSKNWSGSQGDPDTIYTPPNYNEPLVSLDADPQSGVWIYDSTPYEGAVGWQVVGGTSLATPAWAGYCAILDQGLELQNASSISTDALWDDILAVNEVSGVEAGTTFTTFTVPPPAANSYPLWPKTGVGSYPPPDDILTPVDGNSGWGSPIGPNFAAAVVDYDADYAPLVSAVIGTGADAPAVVSDGADLSGNSLDYLAFASEPTLGQAGQSLSNFVVNVDYAFDPGAVDSTFNGPVTISLLVSPTGATLSGTVTVNAVAGVATFSDISVNKLGNYTLEATASSVDTLGDEILPGESDGFYIIPGPGAALTIAQQPTAAWQFADSDSVVVYVLDQFGNVATADNSTVTLSINSGPAGGTIIGTVTAPVVNGTAVFSHLEFDIPGTYKLEVTDGALTPAVTNAFSVVPIPVERSYGFNSFGLSSQQILLEEKRDGLSIADGPPPTPSQVAAAQAIAAISPAESVSPAVAAAPPSTGGAAASMTPQTANLSSDSSNGGADSNLLNGS